MKIIKRLKIYFLILIVGISLILFDGYQASKDEVIFTPKYSHTDNSIETKDGRNLIFADSIDAPKYINEYVGIMKNDTIVSYRRKLGFSMEFIYKYNGDDYKKYRTGYDDNKIEKAISDIQIENLDVKMMDQYAALFWVPLIIAFFTYLISFFNTGINDTGSRYTIIYKILYHVLNFVFSLLLVWWLCNYAIWMFLIVAIYVFATILIIHGDDDLINGIKQYGIAKKTQKNKTEHLIHNYNQLIN